RFQVFGESNASFLEELTSIQGEMSFRTRQDIQGLLDHLGGLHRDMAVLHDNFAGGTYTMRDSMAFVEFINRNIVDIMSQLYNPATKNLIYVDRMGRAQAIEGDYETVFNELRRLQEVSKPIVEEVRKFYDALDLRNNVQAQLIQERARREQNINEKTRKIIDAYIKLEEELKKNFTERLTGRWASFGDWRASSWSKFQSDMEALAQFVHGMQLLDLRLLRNQDAKIGLQIRQAEELYRIKNFGQLNVQQQEEVLTFDLERRKEVWDLARQQDMDRHKIQLEHISKVASAQMGNIKLQRELIKRFMDHAVSQFKIYLDPYGRNIYDTRKELRSIGIEREYDLRITAARKRDTLANVEWEKKAELELQKLTFAEQDKQLRERQQRERYWMDEKQHLELALLEAEFKMRMQQIKAEVEYKHKLESMYKDMESAGTDEMLAGMAITADELRAIGKDISASATPEEIAKIVAFLTQEERNKIAAGRWQVFDSKIQYIADKMKSDGVDVDNVIKAAKEVILNRDDTASIVENMAGVTVDQLKTAINAVENSRETATTSQLALVEQFERIVTLTRAREHSAQMESTRARKVAELEEERKRRKEEAGSKYLEDAKKREEYEAKKVKYEGELEAFNLRKYASSLVELLTGLDGSTDIESSSINDMSFWERVFYNIGKSGSVYVAPEDELLYIKSDAIRMEFDRLVKQLGVTERNDLLRFAVQYGEATSDAKRLEFVNKINEILNKYLPDKGYEFPVRPDEVPAPEDKTAAIDKEFDDKRERLLGEAHEFDETLGVLSTLGESETAAIIAQTELEKANANIMQAYMKELIAATWGEKGEKSEAFQTYINSLEEIKNLESKRDNDLAWLQHNATKTIETIQSQGKIDMDLGRALREDAQEARYANLETGKSIRKAIMDTHFDNKKRWDQLSADLVKRESEYIQKQTGVQTDFAVDMMQARTGTDRLKALAKYNAESQFNMQSTVLDVRHRREMEELQRRGNFTETEKAMLEARQQHERTALEESKRFSDTVREAVGDVGGIRSLVSEGTGATSDLVGTWERIAAAAFGHIEDPAADAVIQMDRAQALQHASLMSLLSIQLPAIARGLTNFQHQAIINQYNNIARAATPPTVAGWS
ncbi:MAG: hypothetical protein GXY86_06080, partial [Firmicutes bacterium]|nr:hypothetical protein [Bacillota bacterium]